MEERLKRIRELARMPMKDDRKLERVEIIILKFREEPKVIDECVSRILRGTNWPFKLTVYDNRENTANTAKIWNKLLKDATCDLVLFIDSDAFISDSGEWLTRLVESSRRNAVTVPVGDNVGGSNKATGPDIVRAEEAQNGIWSGFCFLLNRPLVYKIFGEQPFDEDFYFYGQDSEFAARTLKKQCCVFRWDVFIRHLGSYSGKKAEGAGEFDREADKIYANALYRLKTKK